MCDTMRPTHDQPHVITQRGDACLKEEDGYNGFGLWWVVPNASGPPAIYAAFGKWSPTEEEALGRNIAAAEAVTQLIGDRVIASQGWLQPHHCAVLELTDSETTERKFASLRWGSEALDRIRDLWQGRVADRPVPTILEFIPREINVGSDLLSKGHQEMFSATIVAAGLPTPIFIEISSRDREIGAAIAHSGYLDPRAYGAKKTNAAPIHRQY